MSEIEIFAKTIFNIIVSISILIMCIGVLIWSGLTFFVGMVGIIFAMILHYIISVIDLFYKEKQVCLFICVFNNLCCENRGYFFISLVVSNKHYFHYHKSSVFSPNHQIILVKKSLRHQLFFNIFYEKLFAKMFGVYQFFHYLCTNKMR